MKLDKNQEKKLLVSLYNYIVDTKDEKLEVKPKEYHDDANTVSDIAQTEMEKIEKNKSNVLMNENKIICDNILTKFFELDDTKFLACLNRILNWGFDTCFREFILNYYLYIKKSNRLRQYIIMNLDSIISTLKKSMELTLIENMKNFNFDSYRTHQEVEMLKNDLRNREAALLAIKAKNFNEFAPPGEKRKELLSNGQRKSLRAEIINRLRYENPKLEEDF